MEMKGQIQCNALWDTVFHTVCSGSIQHISGSCSVYSTHIENLSTVFTAQDIK